MSGRLEEELTGLWRKVRYRLYHPRNVWTWMDLNRRFDLRFVRHGSVKVEVPAGLLPDCEECAEVCCTGPNAVVSLRLADIARLVDHGHEQYITHERPAETGGSSWAAQESEWSVFSRVFPVLERDVTGTCALLTDDLHCGAHPAWPLSCARYPYAFDALRRRVFLARGCRSHRTITVDDPPDSVRTLVRAAVDGYNARIRDVILVHIALEELHALGLARHLKLEGRLQSRFEQLTAQAS